LIVVFFNKTRTKVVALILFALFIGLLFPALITALRERLR
jgi:hypothetical protein